MDRFGYVFEEGREENRGVVRAPIARNPSAGGRGGHWAGRAGRARLMASPSGSGTALPWANTAAPVRAGVPSLSDMCLDTLAAHADGLTSIQGVDIHLCTGLLYRIMQSPALWLKHRTDKPSIVLTLHVSSAHGRRHSLLQARARLPRLRPPRHSRRGPFTRPARCDPDA